MITGDYYFINEKEKSVEFFFNGKINDSYYKFYLGQLLVEFLNLDLSDFENSRQIFIDFFKRPSLKKYKNIDNGKLFSNDFYAKLKDKDPLSCRLYLSFAFFYYNRIKLPHPFAKTMPYYIDYINHFSLDTLLYDKFNLLYHQERLLQLINFCFNIDEDENLKVLTPFQRLAIYSRLNKFDSGWLNQMNIYRNYEIFPNDSDTSMIFYTERNGNLYSRSINKKFINEISKIDFNLQEIYTSYDIPTFLFTEFMKIMKLNIRIQKCKNCGKYFVVKGNYDTIYCDNIPEGRKTSCKKIGASNTYKKKMNDNAILKSYSRIYKKYYARRNKNGFTPEKFLQWSDTAKAVKDFAVKKFYEC